MKASKNFNEDGEKTMLQQLLLRKEKYNLSLDEILGLMTGKYKYFKII